MKFDFRRLSSGLWDQTGPNVVKKDLDSELRTWISVVFSFSMALILSTALGHTRLFFVISSVCMGALLLFASRSPVLIRLPVALLISAGGAILAEMNSLFLPELFWPAIIGIALVCLVATIRLCRFEWDLANPAFLVWIFVMLAIKIPSLGMYSLPDRFRSSLAVAQVIASCVLDFLLLALSIQIWRHGRKAMKSSSQNKPDIGSSE